MTNPDATRRLVREAQRQVRFPLLVPTVLERTSCSRPQRRRSACYKIAGRPAVRLVFTNGALEYWGIQMTTGGTRRSSQSPNKTVTLGGRRFELHYAGPQLHMVVLRANGATYWVVNTLLGTRSRTRRCSRSRRA